MGIQIVGHPTDVRAHHECPRSAGYLSHQIIVETQESSSSHSSVRSTAVAGWIEAQLGALGERERAVAAAALASCDAASLASECKGLAHPASVDTIPTVQHHEDHVSMGPIAARMLLEMVECVADIVGIELLLAAQALDLRMRGIAFDADGNPVDAAPVRRAPSIDELHRRVRAEIPYWEDDEVLHPCLASAGRLVRTARILGKDLDW